MHEMKIRCFFVYYGAFIPSCFLASRKVFLPPPIIENQVHESKEGETCKPNCRIIRKLIKHLLCPFLLENLNGFYPALFVRIATDKWLAAKIADQS